MSNSSKSAEYMLFEKGEWSCVIVIPERASELERKAVDELGLYLGKMSGITVDSVNSGKPVNGFQIIPGLANRKYDIPILQLEKEGFYLRTVEDSMYIIGADEEGLLFGVYTFLEDYCGIRWFWPGELGEVVPPVTSFRLPEIDRVETPDFKWRERGPGGPLWGPHDRLTKQQLLGVSEEHMERVKLWEIRNKWGGLNVQGGHEWGNIVPPAKYGRDHPEYYALVDGRRDRDFEHFDGKHGAQLCTTNPDLVPIFMAYFKEYFSEHPECDALHVTPNDGGGFCECERCRKLDTGKMLKKKPDKPVITDRIFSFTSTLAEELQKIHPGKRLVNMAYSWYVDPPEYTTISDCVIPQYCMWSCYLHWNEEKRAEHYTIAQGWAEAAQNVGIYEYYVNGAWPDLPRIIYPKIAESLRYLHGIGIRLYQTQAGDGFAINGLNYYIASKLLWNVDADVEALVDEFYDKAFGEAGKWVRKCSERLQIRWQDAVKRGMHPSCSSFATTVVHELYLPEVLEACQADLDQAHRAVDDALIQRRIEFVQTGLIYTQLTLDAVRITKELETSGVTISAVDFTDEEEIKAVAGENKERLDKDPQLLGLIETALKAWEKRDQYVEKLKDDFAISYFWVKYNDTNRVFNPTQRLRDLLARNE